MTILSSFGAPSLPVGRLKVAAATRPAVPRHAPLTDLFFPERDLLPTRRAGGKCGGSSPVRAGWRSRLVDFFRKWLSRHPSAPARLRGAAWR